MILAFHIEPGEREIPSDFASRLSTVACRDDLWEFCRDFGLDGQGIVDGNEGAVEALSELAGVQASGLLLETFRPMGRKREFVHKGQHFVHLNLMRSRVRACPRCMAEDVERLDTRMAARPHRRSEWIIGAVRTCAIHNLALVELTDGGPRSFRHDTSRALAFAVTRLPRYLKEARERVPSPFETYVAHRLAGSASSPWLDDLPLHAAIRLALTIGAVLIHGPTVSVDGLDDVQRWESEAAGFDVLSGGEDRIRGFLDELQEGFARSRGPIGPKAMFGRLWEFLAYENDAPGYQKMRALISDHVGRTLPISAAAGPTAGKPAARRVQSLHSAAKEYGLEPLRLRKLLKMTGIIAADTDTLTNGRVLFDAETAEPTLRDIASSLTLGEAAKHMDVSTDHITALMAAGYLKPMIAGGTDVLKDYAFRPADLDAFVTRLRGDDPAAEADLSHAEPLPRAALLTCRKVVDVVGMVLDGKLGRVGMRRGAIGLNSILVDVDALRSLIPGPPPGWLLLREAEKELRINNGALRALIANGFMDAITLKNPTHGGTQRLIEKREINKFNERYVTLFNLAQEKRINIRKLKDMLEEAGVKPVRDRNVLECTLYLRSTIDI